MKRSKKPQENLIDRHASLQMVIDRGINLSLGVIAITGPLKIETYEKFARDLSVLNQFENKEITVRLNTDGGDLNTAISIYELIKRNEKPIDIVAIGECMSGGLLIMQAARKRFATPLTQLMTHHGSDKYSGVYRDFQAYAKFAENLEYKIQEIFCDRCDWTEAFYNKINAHDTFMSADEALRINLIDEVN